MNQWIADHAALYVKVSREPDALTDEEIYQMSANVRNVLLNFQDYHLQRNMGLADEITYNNAIHSVRYYMSIPDRAWASENSAV